MLGHPQREGPGIMDGKALREARRGQRMTQAHLALAAGVSERTVIRAERGVAVAAESWRSICAALGLDAAVTSVAVAPAPEAVASDLEGWRSDNGMRLWTAVAALAGGCCVLAAGLALAAVADADTPTQATAGMAVAAASCASLAYVVSRVLRYVGVANGIEQRRYAVDGREVVVDEGEPGRGVIRVTRIGPCKGVEEIRPYRLWPRARAARLSLAGGGHLDIEGVSASVLADLIAQGRPAGAAA